MPVFRQPQRLFGQAKTQRIQLTEMSLTVLAKMPIAVPAVPNVGREAGSLVNVVIGLSLRDVVSWTWELQLLKALSLKAEILNGVRMRTSSLCVKQ